MCNVDVQRQRLFIYLFIYKLGTSSFQLFYYTVHPAPQVNLGTQYYDPPDCSATTTN